MIFDVQRFCTHDGPGIRTVVFLKGCSMRCQWCSNPESQKSKPEILFDAGLCLACRACLNPRFGGAMQELEGKIQPDRSKPVPEGLSKVCPSLALRVAGRLAAPKALVNEVCKDSVFFCEKRGWGDVLGGEPLEQAGYVLQCSRLFQQRGVSVAIETSLAVEPRALELLLGSPIEWLVDVKHVVPQKFRRQTGGSLEQVLTNIRRVSKASDRVTYRIPVIPGFNDCASEREGLLEFLSSLERASGGPIRLELLPYHDLAAGKYVQLDRPNPFNRKPLPEAVVETWKLEAETRGFVVNRGG